MFARRFGAPVEQLAELVERKTVTLEKLLALAPAGTPNPSSTLYNSTLYLMAGLQVIGFLANLCVRPVREEMKE